MVEADSSIFPYSTQKQQQLFDESIGVSDWTNDIKSNQAKSMSNWVTTNQYSYDGILGRAPIADDTSSHGRKGGYGVPRLEKKAEDIDLNRFK